MYVIKHVEGEVFKGTQVRRQREWILWGAVKGPSFDARIFPDEAEAHKCRQELLLLGISPSYISVRHISTLTVEG